MSLTTPELLRRGYFPRELPPAFTTISYGDYWEKHAGKIKATIDTKGSYRASSYFTARPGTLSRQHSIVHPASFGLLSEEVAKNWSYLVDHCAISKISKSKPRFDKVRRAIEPISEFGELPFFRAAVRSKARYVVKADVARFFPSVYTHSIPWALHTKAIAKVDRSDKLLGNRLDKCSSRLQDGQTLGIPIGPDTSRIISELILSCVDSQLQKDFRNSWRYSDDLEIGVASYSEALECIARLRELFREFELALNETKTKIIELPNELNRPWHYKLKALFADVELEFGKHNAIRYFDAVFELSRAYPSDSVVKYGLSLIASTLGRVSWGTLQELLCQCLIVEPNAAQHVSRVLLMSKTQRTPVKISSPKLKDALELSIVDNAMKGDSNEVAWALWTALAFNVRLTKATAQAVLNMKDCVCALLTMNASHAGCIGSKLDWSWWEASLTPEGLRDERWLFAYEASLKGWMTPVVDHIATDPFFKKLRDGGVTFMESSAAISKSKALPPILLAVGDGGVSLI